MRPWTQNIISQMTFSKEWQSLKTQYLNTQISIQLGLGVPKHANLLRMTETWTSYDHKLKLWHRIAKFLIQSFQFRKTLLTWELVFLNTQMRIILIHFPLNTPNFAKNCLNTQNFGGYPLPPHPPHILRQKSLRQPKIPIFGRLRRFLQPLIL